MSFDPPTESECDVGRAGSSPWALKVRDSLLALHSTSASTSKVPNGSFEIDSDSDGIPDLWDKDLYPGGSFSLQDADDDTSIHGAACVKFTHPGGASNGGGNLTSDYMEVQEGRDLIVGWSIKVSATGAKNQVVVRYFDEDKVDLSADDTIYSSTSGPTSWTAVSVVSTPPANARYCKIKLIGGFTDTDPGASRDTYFDDIWLKEDEPLNVVSGDYFFHPAYRGSTQSTSYTKTIEFYMPRSGTINAVLYLYNSGGGLIAYGRVYVNGTPQGTERNTTSASPIRWIEDIDVEAGDLVQLYLKNQAGIDATLGVLLICIEPPVSIDTQPQDYVELTTSLVVNLPLIYS